MKKILYEAEKDENKTEQLYINIDEKFSEKY